MAFLETMWSLGNRGQINEIRRRLANGTDIDERNPLGQTALWGATHYHTPTLQFLIDKGADMNIRNIDGNAPIHGLQWYDRSHGVSLRMLVEAGCRTDTRNFDRETPLEVAIRISAISNDDGRKISFLELRSRDNVLQALKTYDTNYDVPLVLFELIADFVTSV